ncbi:MAG: hypothetical protein IKD45_03925 [Clostridia bacterium]|nr:hypothetical protein [Clostridia bacterium]
MKIKKILLSTFLVIALMLCNLGSVVANASNIDTGYRELWYRPDTYVINPAMDTAAAEYFSLLINYYGNNTHNTCAHVAIAMLLSYYNFCVDDRFMFDQYEVDSNPDVYGSSGIMFENNIQYEGTYADYVEEYADRSLHCKLIQMCAELGYYESNARTTVDGVPNLDSYALSTEEIEELLRVYIESSVEVCGPEGMNDLPLGTAFVESMDYSEYTEVEMLEQIIYLLTYNTPVLVLAARQPPDNYGGNTGHAMIAYDYNPQATSLLKGNIYVHSGWHDSQDKRVKTLTGMRPYNNIYRIIWINMPNPGNGNNNE